jgi:ribonucleoside-triphosphate reductase
MDYFLQHMHNCDLVNIEDMLQNGTTISGTKIDTPHSFSTACNITTQIIAQVASSQYGGQSITLSHLAPFVDVSRKKITKKVVEELDEGIDNKEINIEKGSDKYNSYIKRVVDKRVREEVERGVQTIQYQVVTLMTTNGYYGHAA